MMSTTGIHRMKIQRIALQATQIKNIIACIKNPWFQSLRACYAHTAAISPSIQENLVFDTPLKTLQRDGAARSFKNWRDKYESTSNIHPSADDFEFVDYDYLYREIAYRLVDRLEDIKREQGFPLALDIGRVLSTKIILLVTKSCFHL